MPEAPVLKTMGRVEVREGNLGVLLEHAQCRLVGNAMRQPPAHMVVGTGVAWFEASDALSCETLPSVFA
jgi:hypothetical protein